MAKDKVTSETETKQVETVDLDECIFELESLQTLLETFQYHDAKISTSEMAVMILLAKGASKKLSYFQGKYDFQVDIKDKFYVEGLLEFVQKLPAKTE